MLDVGDKVRLIEHIDEGCYKCPQKGDVGRIVALNPLSRDGSPNIEVLFSARQKPVFCDEWELEVVDA